MKKMKNEVLVHHEGKLFYSKPMISVFEIFLESGITNCSQNQDGCDTGGEPNPGGGDWDDGGDGSDGGGL